MTDRELLELAAKAYNSGNDAWQCADYQRGFIGSWDPIESDSEALRLAVKLEMDVVHYSGSVECYFWLDEENDEYVSEEISGCRLAATRRAIVRAAAAIGGKL